jgi:hypothetical protein
MNNLQKRAIAKIAYKQVMAVMDQWYSSYDLQISFHWDGCITIDDEFFHEYQLREHEEVE